MENLLSWELMLVAVSQGPRPMVHSHKLLCVCEPRQQGAFHWMTVIKVAVTPAEFCSHEQSGFQTAPAPFAQGEDSMRQEVASSDHFHLLLVLCATKGSLYPLPPPPGQLPLRNGGACKLYYPIKAMMCLLQGW